MNFTFFDNTAAYFPDVCFALPPDLGILLGSGWGEALEMDEIVFRASYSDIPGLGASTVKGHAGEFILYDQKSAEADLRHGRYAQADPGEQRDKSFKQCL